MDYNLSQPSTRTMDDIYKTPSAQLSDADIAAIAGTGAYAADMRDDLYARRAEARAANVEAAMAEQKAVAAADASVIFGINVTGPQGSGKTALLTVIMDALAERGLLTHEMTVIATLDPFEAVGMSRTGEGLSFERIGVEIKTADVVNEMIALRSTEPVETEDCDCDGPEIVTGEPVAFDGTAVQLTMELDAADVSMEGWRCTIEDGIEKFFDDGGVVPLGTGLVSFVFAARA